MSWLNPFDFNRDGKISMDEGFLEYMVMEECMKPAPSNYRRKRRHTSDIICCHLAFFPWALLVVCRCLSVLLSIFQRLEHFPRIRRTSEF